MHTTPHRARLARVLITSAAQAPISKIMSRAVICVRHDASVAVVASLFAERGLRGAAVLDDHRALVGFIAADALVDGLATPVASEIMAPTSIRLEEHAPITLAAAVMVFEGVHHLPVTSTRGDIVGVVSGLDLLRWLAREDGYLLPEPLTTQGDSCG